MFRIFTAKTLTISAIRRDFLITLSNANDAEDKLINPESDTFGSTSRGAQSKIEQEKCALLRYGQMG